MQKKLRIFQANRRKTMHFKLIIVVGEQRFPQLQTLKKLRIFQANRRGRRATISPAPDAKKLHIFQANRRGRRATISSASNAKKLCTFQALQRGLDRLGRH